MFLFSCNKEVTTSDCLSNQRTEYVKVRSILSWCLCYGKTEGNSDGNRDGIKSHRTYDFTR